MNQIESQPSNSILELATTDIISNDLSAGKKVIRIHITIVNV